ncbi:substrate-binding domain-containing protein [Nonomuraea sp. NPDC049709]|uniref:substrate-binding domain-containing protein n=1 Tax=Nonomuraea sp. NPDC049709 TaxID=3154736 RepID=UPI003420861D
MALAAPRCSTQGRLEANADARIYDSDVTAAAGLCVATEREDSVPAELSLVSFDASILTTLPHPPITALTRTRSAPSPPPNCSR